MVDPGRLLPLLHRRWTLAVLAELHAGRGAKFVTLVHRLAASRDAVRAALDDLIAGGLVVRNPGYGHPLRPEYLLTPAGERAATATARVVDRLRRRSALEVALQKWPLAVALALRGGAGRFNELKADLPGITARALTLALKTLLGSGLAERRVTAGYPPRSQYRLTPAGRRLAGLVESLATAA